MPNYRISEFCGKIFCRILKVWASVQLFWELIARQLGMNYANFNIWTALASRKIYLIVLSDSLSLNPFALTMRCIRYP